MYVSEETFHADWFIHYPNEFDEEHVPHLLRPFTRVKHEWNAFPWYQSGGMVGLLENPRPNFDYLHLTWFFLARAAMLTMKGDLVDQRDVCTALRQHRVQWGGIYREHVLFGLRAFLKKHNVTELPGCDTEQFDPLHSDDQAEKNRIQLQRVLRSVEHDYIKTLNVICSATDMKERVSGHSVGFWVKGADMPMEEGMQGRKREFAGGYCVLPPRDEAKQRNREGGRWEGIVVSGPDEGRDPKPHTAERRADEAAVEDDRHTVYTAKAAEQALAPVVEIFKKAVLVSTPPHKRKWWQNLRERYGREPGPRETDKWCGVAKVVVAGAIEELKKPVRARHSDYVTPLMLARLLAKLNAPGASRAAIEADYADTLRRCVAREERKAASQ